MDLYTFEGSPAEVGRAQGAIDPAYAREQLGEGDGKALQSGPSLLSEECGVYAAGVSRVCRGDGGIWGGGGDREV